MALVTKSFSDIITFTRTSTATFFNSAGVLTSAGNNVPRFDYDPATLAAQGLLIEEARTNSIRNNTMQGAGTPGTLPTNWAIGGSGLGTLNSQVVDISTVNGINYIDMRFWGTNSTTDFSVRFEPSGIVTATQGQTWTNSFWSAIVAGSTNNINTINVNIAEFNAGGTVLNQGNSANLIPGLTATMARSSLTRTLTEATTASIQPRVVFTFSTTGLTIDITLRIGLPQLEQGAFATSVIPTTTTALTRNADVASVNTLSPWFNATAGTLYAEAQHYAPSAVAQQWQAQLASGSGDYYGIYKESSPANITTRVRSGGADQAFAYTTGAISANTIYKTALGYAVNDVASCTNGGTVFVDTPPAALPLSITALGLGQPTYTTSVMLNGYLRRITYFPRRMGNAELVALTAPISSTTSVQPYSLDTNFIGNTVSIGS